MTDGIRPTDENVAKFYAQFTDKSDIELLTISKSDHSSYATGIAAAKILSERQAKEADEKHIELLAEIKHPHWSVTPGFLVGVVAMIAACIAEYPVLFQQPHAQQSLPIVTKFAQTTQPAISNPSNMAQTLIPLSKNNEVKENNTSEIQKYLGLIQNKIRRNTWMPDNVPSGSNLEFDVELKKDGYIVSEKLFSSSGNIEYDNAVKQAILKAQPLPLPPNPALFKQFHHLHLKFQLPG